LKHITRLLVAAVPLLLASTAIAKGRGSKLSADENGIVLLLVLIITPIVGLVIWLSKPPCPKCGARSLSYRHPTKSGQPDRRYSYNPQICTACGWSSHELIQEEYRPPTVPPFVPVNSRDNPSPRPSDSDILNEALLLIAEQRGPVTRARVVSEMAAKLSTAGARQELLLKASKLEVASVLEKVAKLKTRDAKVRNLSQAIAQLKSDSLDDELQKAEIELLEKALASLQD
jgi:hypothetical protein